MFISCVLFGTGSRINVHKSNVYGIGVSPDDIEQMARATGCSAVTMPFTYLGLPIIVGQISLINLTNDYPNGQFYFS